MNLRNVRMPYVVDPMSPVRVDARRYMACAWGRSRVACAHSFPDSVVSVADLNKRGKLGRTSEVRGKVSKLFDIVFPSVVPTVSV